MSRRRDEKTKKCHSESERCQTERERERERERRQRDIFLWAIGDMDLCQQPHPLSVPLHRSIPCPTNARLLSMSCFHVSRSLLFWTLPIRDGRFIYVFSPGQLETQHTLFYIRSLLHRINTKKDTRHSRLPSSCPRPCNGRARQQSQEQGERTASYGRS